MRPKWSFERAILAYTIANGWILDQIERTHQIKKRFSTSLTHREAFSPVRNDRASLCFDKSTDRLHVDQIGAMASEKIWKTSQKLLKHKLDRKPSKDD